MRAKSNGGAMLKLVLGCLLLVPVMAVDTGDRFLSKIDLYQKDSYFKTKVYAQHNWKSFYDLPDAKKAIDPQNYDMHLLSAAVFFSTNKLRESKGMKVFKFSSGLRDAAVVHSHQMVEKNFFDHFNGRTPALRTPEQRMKLFGVTPNATAENVDLNYMALDGKTTYLQLADVIVDALYHSPPHRKNMMNKIYGHLGCGAVLEFKNRDGVRYVKATQDFTD